MVQSFLINPDIADRLSHPNASPAGIGRLVGASMALASVELATELDAPLVLFASDPRHADKLEAEIRWFADDSLTVMHFVEWETLPYDSFSPHQDIISDRLRVLSLLPALTRGIVIVSGPSLLQRLPPVEYVSARTLELSQDQALDRRAFIHSLAAAGYLRVPQVDEHGEYAVRGSLLDVFPMGSDQPLRIDFFDDDVESLRFFDPESQLSGDKVSSISILPAREIPLDQQDIQAFRQRYRERFEGRPSASRVYREVSDGIAHGGIEYYLPLFYSSTASFLDYLPTNAVIFAGEDLEELIEQSWAEIGERYELCSLDPERPVLMPAESFHQPADILEQVGSLQCIDYSAQTLQEAPAIINPGTSLPPAIRIEARYEDSAQALMQFLESFDGRVLFTADSPGRRESIVELLAGRHVHATRCEDWPTFVAGEMPVGVAVAPIEEGALLTLKKLAIISEHQLFGDKPRQRNRRRRADRDPESIIRQLNELEPGSPVVHSEYGIGRYHGLTTLEAGGVIAEFLYLEYADGDKLYVPVHALDLISRYTGTSPQNAPLHRLGSDQWAKAKKRAIKRIRDVAAELLDVYARRAARPGHRFHWP
ncbi:MAG: CarD family transcriptional regulator, partial [Woeseiaceae bacterium]|nr:CarD family transcriptional regulator [Woeseiaceae bacterium]